MTEKTDDNIDRKLGQNIRALRLSAGLSQQAIADLFGLTYQQIQKYEHGKSRIPAKMLIELQKLYNVPYETFFAGLRTAKESAIKSPLQDYDDMTLKIARRIAAINDSGLKQKIGQIVTILASH